MHNNNIFEHHIITSLKQYLFLIGLGGPTIENCPDNQIANHDENTGDTVFTWIEPTSPDGTLQLRNVAPPSSFGRGCTPIFYIFENQGNTESCSFAVCLWPEGNRVIIVAI